LIVSNLQKSTSSKGKGELKPVKADQTQFMQFKLPISPPRPPLPCPYLTAHFSFAKPAESCYQLQAGLAKAQSRQVRNFELKSCIRIRGRIVIRRLPLWCSNPECSAPPG
jgi:hypothetical protein